MKRSLIFCFETLVIALFLFPVSADSAEATETPQDRGIISVAWSPDGLTIVGAGKNGFLRLWDAATGTTLFDFPTLTEAIYSVAWSPDSALLASAGEDKLIHIWDVKTGAAIAVLPGHNDTINSVAWSSDGTMLASASLDEMYTLRTWKVADYALVGKLQAGDLQQVSWRPDGTRLALLNTNVGVMLLPPSLDIGSIQNLINYTFGPSNRFSGASTAMGWHPDGDIFAVGFQVGTIYIWDVIADRPLLILGKHQQAVTLDERPTGSDAVSSLAWSPDGTRLMSSSNDGTITIWDATTGMALDTFDKGAEFTKQTAWSPDSSQIAFGDTETTTLYIEPAPAPTQSWFMSHCL